MSVGTETHPVNVETSCSGRKLFLDSLPDGLITIDRQHRIVAVNTSAANIFGYTRDELLGQPLSILVPDHASGRHEQDVDGILTGPDTGRFMANREAIEGVRKSGEGFPARASLVKYTEDDGSPRATAVVRDISAERARERALEAAEAKQRAILETSPETVLLIDAESARVVEANARAAALFACPVEELVGTHVSQLQPAYVAETPHSDLTSFAAGTRTFLPETDIQRADGMVVTVEVAGQLATVNARRLAIAHMREITQWKTMEHALRESREAAAAASRMKSTHILKVSRDIGLAVDAVAGLTAGLTPTETTGEGNRSESGLSAVLMDAAAYLRRLVNDTLIADVGDLENTPITPETVDIAAELQLARSLATAAKGREAEAVTVSAPDHLRAQVDPVAVRRVIMTLTGNALDVTPSPGQVHLDASLDAEGALTISVRDQGPGIAQDKIDRILADQPGQRDQQRLTVKTLELAVIRALMRAHGGEMTVRSETERGTTIGLRVPAKRVLRKARALGGG